MQDLIHGVNNADITALLKSAFLSLENGDFSKAYDFCEQVLNMDAECAEAYVGRLMADLKVNNREMLSECDNPFDGNDNYRKIQCCGDDNLRTEMSGYIAHINERNEKRLMCFYNNATEIMNTANTEDTYKFAVEIFQRIRGFKDADALAERCLQKAEICRKDTVYNEGLRLINGELFVSSRKNSLEKAISIFESISGWKDSEGQINNCKREIAEIDAKEKADRLEAERKAEEQREANVKAKKKKKTVIAILTTVVCVCVAFIIVLNTVIIPKQKLNHELEILKEASIGDTVLFGTYEQDNNTTNGKEDIEWIVLEKEDDKILVISDKALDCQPYNTECTEVTWEDCTLRKWLNGMFIDEAFSAEEQAIIQSTTVSADNNPEYDTDPGNDTTDKVFLLSITEAEKYFLSDEDRKCIPTEYAIEQGCNTSSDYSKGGFATCWWWLRSSGYTQYIAAGVTSDGSVSYRGSSVFYDRDCVRPALWINLDS